jgi:hypothetical protein
VRDPSEVGSSESAAKVGDVSLDAKRRAREHDRSRCDFSVH